VLSPAGWSSANEVSAAGDQANVIPDVTQYVAVFAFFSDGEFSGQGQSYSGSGGTKNPGNRVLEGRSAINQVRNR
jgi:hypothetical protein